MAGPACTRRGGDLRRRRPATGGDDDPAQSSRRSGLLSRLPLSAENPFPSESRVKTGIRVVHGDVALEEKLGRNDPCPCGSTRSFQALLHALGPA
ncbi:SEC-C metal-binding domain-containing protein [Methylobacterium brachythecii]|uniref:SEC-C metal-binding domain-containing protein n=1 Tax=Methylobacterium brachythecii TaxID=1176177 RepID=UPI001FE6B7FE|nr:SEC-C metal-binding domain-containing protein [Methylobacterium brachythecii]